MHYFTNLFWYRTLHVDCLLATVNIIRTANTYCCWDSWWWTVHLSKTCSILYRNEFV